MPGRAHPGHRAFCAAGPPPFGSKSAQKHASIRAPLPGVYTTSFTHRAHTSASLEAYIGAKLVPVQTQPLRQCGAGRPTAGLDSFCYRGYLPRRTSSARPLPCETNSARATQQCMYGEVTSCRKTRAATARLNRRQSCGRCGCGSRRASAYLYTVMSHRAILRRCATDLRCILCRTPCPTWAGCTTTR